MRTKAQVKGSALTAYPGAAPIALDSLNWFHWLQRHESFSYQDKAGSFTARCEPSKDRKRWYWYAYRTIGAKLRRVYLGVDQSLTLTCLQAAAAKLAQAKAQPMPWDEESYDATKPYFAMDTIRQAQEELNRIRAKMNKVKRGPSRDKKTLLAIAAAALTDLAVILRR